MKNKKQEITLYNKHSINPKKFSRNFSTITLMATPIKNELAPKITIFSCKTKFDS